MSTATAIAPAARDVTAIRDSFRRDGFARIPGALADQAPRLRALIDEVFETPGGEPNRYGEFVAVRLFERDRAFRDLLTAEPWISLAEDILGGDCHLVAQNAVRNRPGESISTWHVDDGVLLHAPAGSDGLDPALPLPMVAFTVQILLSDVPDDDHGPTQFVPGSQYAGRNPPAGDEAPTFRGRGPVPIHGRAGDAYLHDPQCWHRGAPNRSGRTRYLLQLAYGRRWVAQRFHPFIDYRMPAHVWEGADERLQRVLGRHPKGAYG